jgi:hypothetical protein
MPTDAVTLWRAFAFAAAVAWIGVAAAAAGVQMQRAAVAAFVPASMQLTESLRQAMEKGVVAATRLAPIALRNDPVTLAALVVVAADAENTVPLQDVVRSWNAPSLCFVVRRPG